MHYFLSRGDEVTVIVSKVGKDVKVPEGVRIIRIPLSMTPKWLRVVRYDAQLGRIVAQNDFDLILSMGRTTHHHAMIVAGVHEAFRQAQGKRFRGLSDWLQNRQDARSYAAPGVLFAASEMIRDQMLAFHEVDPNKIKVLYPPTDPARFNRSLRPNRETLRKRFGMDEAKTVFVIISGNHELKGLPLLLEVFARLTDSPFELLVAGPQSVHTSLPNVRYLGFVRDTEALFSAADCTLLPSRYDAFGQVVTESLLCGTPVIVSTMTGASAIVTEQEGIVLDSFSPDEWEKAIRSIPERTFEISDDLARERGLRFEDHMQRLVDLAN